MADEEHMGPMRHITQPVICSMVSTLSVEQHRNESQDQSTVDAMICKVCGDVPKPFARPPGKIKPAKVPKTPEQKKMELEKYWVKTADMMEEETEFVDQIFGDELDGIQKAVPVAVKDIRQMEPEQKQIWIKAIIK